MYIHRFALHHTLLLFLSHLQHITEHPQCSLLLTELRGEEFDGFGQLQADLVEAFDKEVEDSVRGLEMDASGMDQQGEVELQLKGPYLPFTLQAVLLSNSIVANTKYLKLRLLLLVSRVLAQPAQQSFLRLLLFLGLLLGHFLDLRTFLGLNSLYLHVIPLILEIHLRNFWIEVFLLSSATMILYFSSR